MENLFLSKMYCSLQNKVPQLEEGTDKMWWCLETVLKCTFLYKQNLTVMGLTALKDQFLGNNEKR